MDKKEIVLSRIAEIISRDGFLKKSNSEIRSRLRCIGLGEYFTAYENCLTPYSYNQGYAAKFENPDPEYDVYLGLDGIFSDLYKEHKDEDIIALLKELTKSFNTCAITRKMGDDFDELSNLYSLLGLELESGYDDVSVTTCMQSNKQRVQELFSVEDWLEQNHRNAYDAYESAIDAYTQGHAGACIESCRTCLVSLFSEYKGTEEFSKWMRGVYNTSGENLTASTQDLSNALNKELKKEDLADFFSENREGKLTKTKTIYMIYSMMSDYGTHRNESTIEAPTIEDALFSLRLMDSILFWVYAKISRKSYLKFDAGYVPTN